MVCGIFALQCDARIMELNKRWNNILQKDRGIVYS